MFGDDVGVVVVDVEFGDDDVAVAAVVAVVAEAVVGGLGLEEVNRTFRQTLYLLFQPMFQDT